MHETAAHLPFSPGINHFSVLWRWGGRYLWVPTLGSCQSETYSVIIFNNEHCSMYKWPRAPSWLLLGCLKSLCLVHEVNKELKSKRQDCQRVLTSAVDCSQSQCYSEGWSDHSLHTAGGERRWWNETRTVAILCYSYKFIMTTKKKQNGSFTHPIRYEKTLRFQHCSSSSK